MTEVSQEVLEELYKAEQKVKKIEAIAKRVLKPCPCLDLCYCESDRHNALQEIKEIIEGEEI